MKREKICEIYCCSSGKEYLECGIEPDILFLDIELGDMTGIEIADMTALGMKETYIIYISNYVDYMQQIICRSGIMRQQGIWSYLLLSGFYIAGVFV